MHAGFPAWLDSAFVRERGTSLERLRFPFQAAVVPALLALVLILGVTPGVASAAGDEPDQSGSVQARYASASTSADAVPAAVTPVPVRSRNTLGSLPEAFTLITVGSMLLGLAAAVRKTTT